MPTYDYQCERCGALIEKMHGIKKNPKFKCPKGCGVMKRLISGGGGVIFKGEGFYANDYSDDPKKKGKRRG